MLLFRSTARPKSMWILSQPRRPST
jgi:hypothetical protein